MFSKEEIQKTALSMRKNMLKAMLDAGANGAHIGGAYSCTEILAVLYKSVMNVNPNDNNRDRFIMSKGHASIAWYAILHEIGLLSEEEFFSFEKDGSEFSTHAHENVEKGIELTSGSLGLGLSFGIGTSIYAKRNGLSYRTFVLLGDGECNEGTVWEAAQAASNFKLDNLVAIVDQNGQQLDGYCDDVIKTGDLKKVFEGFGWNSIEVDGHDIEVLYNALKTQEKNGKPLAVIAKTIKGKGVSFMEGKLGWHHAGLSQEQYDLAIKDLEVPYGV